MWLLIAGGQNSRSAHHGLNEMGYGKEKERKGTKLSTQQEFWQRKKIVTWPEDLLNSWQKGCRYIYPWKITNVKSSDINEWYWQNTFKQHCSAKSWFEGKSRRLTVKYTRRRRVITQILVMTSGNYLQLRFLNSNSVWLYLMSQFPLWNLGCKFVYSVWGLLQALVSQKFLETSSYVFCKDSAAECHFYNQPLQTRSSSLEKPSCYQKTKIHYQIRWTRVFMLQFTRQSFQHVRNIVVLLPCSRLCVTCMRYGRKFVHMGNCWCHILAPKRRNSSEYITIRVPKHFRNPEWSRIQYAPRS